MTPDSENAPTAKRTPSARDQAIETAIFVASLAVVIATLVRSWCSIAPGSRAARSWRPP
jgi:hypothetical protein